MLAPVALLCLLAQSQTLTLRGVTFHLMGYNGYEDFLRAAVILDEPKNRELEAYIRFRTSTEKNPQPAPRPAGVPDQATYLDLYRIQATQLESVIRWIEAGIAKPCHLPEPNYSPLTLQPELQYFRVAERVILRAARAAFGSGDRARGSHLMLDGLEFTHSVATGGVLGGMVARTCEQMALFEVQQNSAKLTKQDAERLANWAKRMAAKPSPILSMAETERKGLRNFYDGCFIASREDFGWTDEGGAEMIKTLHDMPPARREQIYRRYFMRLEAPWSALKHQLSLPESRWLSPVKVEDFIESDPPNADIDGKTMTAMLGLLKLEAVIGADDVNVPTICRSALSIRVQERVLGVTCAVLRYRLAHGRLPKGLQEVFGVEPHDPATERPYGFELRPESSFRIVCAVEGIGEVDLQRVGTTSTPNPAP